MYELGVSAAPPALSHLLPKRVRALLEQHGGQAVELRQESLLLDELGETVEKAAGEA